MGIQGKTSPDGKWIVYTYQEAGPVPVEKFAVIPAEGGAAVHVFPHPVGAGDFGWAPDSKGFQVIFTQKGASNIWEQPLDGGPRTPSPISLRDAFSVLPGPATAKICTWPKAKSRTTWCSSAISDRPLSCWPKRVCFFRWIQVLSPLALDVILSAAKDLIRYGVLRLVFVIAIRAREHD